MIITFIDRQITRSYPNSLTACLVRITLAKLRLRRELDKTLLIKSAKWIVESFSKECLV